MYHFCFMAGVLGASELDWWSEDEFIGSGMESRGHLHVPQAATSWNLVRPCPPRISFNAHTPVCNPARWLLPRQMISCFPVPALYLIQVPQTLGEKKFQRFAWGCKAGSHVRQSRLSDPALMLWTAASRMPVACPHGSAGPLSLKYSLDLVSGSSTRRDSASESYTREGTHLFEALSEEALLGSLLVPLSSWHW